MLLTTIPGISEAQYISSPDNQNFLLSGIINDQKNHHFLAGANISLTGRNTGTVTDLEGAFSLELPKDNYELHISFVGYKNIDTLIVLDHPLHLLINLETENKELEEVIVSAGQGKREMMEGNVLRLTSKEIEKIPVFMGEKDMMKTAQLLPGINQVIDGHSGITVRGGEIDQNLILLDHATLYNPSHLLGFFSIFYDDAIRDLTVYKGGQAANFGGRLSSVINIRMEDGAGKPLEAIGEIGLISSKLSFRGPIIKDKTSFNISARRSYADIFIPMLPYTDLKTSRLYFYDIYAKAQHTFTRGNNVSFSFYKGNDVFKNDYAYTYLGNEMASLNYQNRPGSRTGIMLNLHYSNYKYDLGTVESEHPNSFEWKSEIMELGLNADFSYKINRKNSLEYGLQLISHVLDPCLAEGKGEGSMLTSFRIEPSRDFENALYISHRSQIAKKLSIRYGIRYSIFSNLGSRTVFRYDPEFVVTDSTYYPDGRIYHSSHGPEPRVKISWQTGKLSRLEFSYNRNRQYMQLANESLAGTPLDIWFTSGPNIRPQVADQYTIGFFRPLFKQKIAFSIETYYKNQSEALDFKDHAKLWMNPHLETEIRRGKAWAYGIEFTFHKSYGRLNGWINYSYSRSFRKISGINNNKAYPSEYDTPHDASIMINFEISPRINISAVWVYATGKPITLPAGKAIVNGTTIPVYNERNSDRLPDYHRLDLSLVISGKEHKRFHGEWNLSVYNAYNRKNAISVNFVKDSSDPSKIYAEKNYLFPILPSISYKFYIR